MKITNNLPTAINGWTLQFEFANGQTFTDRWNGNYTQSGPGGRDVRVTNVATNATIGANGGSKDGIGFNATVRQRHQCEARQLPRERPALRYGVATGAKSGEVRQGIKPRGAFQVDTRPAPGSDIPGPAFPLCRNTSQPLGLGLALGLALGVAGGER